jgi:hypothetical protein
MDVYMIKSGSLLFVLSLHDFEPSFADAGKSLIAAVGPEDLKVRVVIRLRRGLHRNRYFRTFRHLQFDSINSIFVGLWQVVGPLSAPILRDFTTQV